VAGGIKIAVGERGAKAGVSSWINLSGMLEVCRPKTSYPVAGLPQPGGSHRISEKRRSPQVLFIASAELIEVKADVRIASRVSELSGTDASGYAESLP